MSLSGDINSNNRMNWLQFVVGAFGVAVLLAGSLVIQGEAWAGALTGYLDWSYIDTHDKTEAGPASSETDNTILHQQYYLLLRQDISPALSFYGSGLFDQAIGTNTLNGQERHSRNTLIRPYLDLKWEAYLFQGDLAYYRNQTRTSVSGSPKVNFINETYQGRIGWKPAGLPTLDVFFNHTNFFDKDRVSTDSVSDQVSWTAQYDPVRHLYLRLTGSYIDTQNRITNVETKILGNDLRADYSNSFFNDRVTYSQYYEISHNNTDITASGKGEVTLFVQPVEGLFSETTTPLVGALASNDALINNNTDQPAGVPIGVPSPGNDTPRNIGLGFVTATEINTLFVWVDRDLGDLARFYSPWAVYVSRDEQQTWQLITTLPSAPFIQNHFEINFPNVTAKYVKVVVKPLTAADAANDPTFPNPDQIQVTEIQAFIRQPAPGGKRSLSATSQRLNSNMHVWLLANPNVYYDFTYALTTVSVSGGPSTTTWTLSNTLGASKNLSRVFTARAYLGRQDYSDPSGDTTVYLWTAALDAVPLSTLQQNLTYSGTSQQQKQGTTKANSLTFSNTAELYKDISMFLNAAASIASQTDGSDTKSTAVNSGISLSPSQKLSLTLSYGYNRTRQSGGNVENLSATSTLTDLAVTYNPFPALSFWGDWAWQTTTGQENVFLQDYNINWSPFQGGTLVLSFYYNETLSQINDQKTTLIRPNLRWNVTKSSFLNLSYSIIDSDAKAPGTGLSLKERQKIFAAEYRVNF
jgi:hypothetical protein